MKFSRLTFLPLMVFAATAHAGMPAAQVVNEGGIRFLQSVEKQSSGNICLSPYSIQSALAMTFAGSDGSTRGQMAEALGFPKNPVDLAGDFQKLDADLAASVQVSGSDSTLRVANRLFGALGFSFRPGFLDLLKEAFSAPLEPLDFKKNPPLAAEAINHWVEKQTGERIKNLIPPNALTRDTTLVLVNALYFKMPWAEEFPGAATKPRPFLVGGREKVNVPTMSNTGSLRYLQSQGFTAVGIPFRKGQFQLLILLPDRQTPSALPTGRFLEECASLPSAEVSLFLPKFRLEPPTLSLAETLQSLGMKAAFDIPQGSANFDAMAPRKPDDYLYLSDVFHKTFFALDEKGVEAAAATAVVMMRATSMPPDPVEVRVDRPFLFAIQHISSSACLFLGRVTDPR